MSAFRIFTVLFILAQLNLSSQNLVPNFSFEQNTSCPDDVGQVTRATGWTDIHNLSTDYFNSCASNHYVSVPGNWFGNQAAADGNAYIGFRAWMYDLNDDYREYPGITLSSPLDSCQLYHVSFKISRAGGTSSSYATDAIGLYFSDVVLDPAYSYTTYFNPQIKNPAGNFITDTTGWTTISGNYIAHGGEMFIAIGNFSPDFQTSVIQLGGLYGSAYYYVDDVHVEPVQNLTSNLNLCTGDTLTLQSGFTLPITWSDGSTNSTLNVSSGGAYWFDVNSGNCQLSDTIEITQIDPPSFDLGNDTVLCDGEKLTIGANVNGNYTWNNGSDANWITTDTSGLFTLTVNNSGCVSSDEINVALEDCIYIPNAFSPNGDNNNDVFLVRGYHSGYFHFSIYDRWGTRVYDSVDPVQGWDGMINGKAAEEAVYTYFVELDSKALQKQYVRQGNVSLIR